MISLTPIIETIRSAVRYKLLALVLFPILLVMPIALVLAIYWGKGFAYEQLFIKVNTDLTVAHDVFKRIREDYLSRLGLVAESHSFYVALEKNDTESIKQQLTILKNTSGFDYLHLLDTQGNLLVENYSVEYNRVSELLLSAAHGEPSVGIEIFDHKRMLAENKDLAQQIILPLIETEHARPTGRRIEDRGMVIRAIYPAKNSKGKVIALLDGGVFLNLNFTFVDTIRDLVYGHGSLPEDSIGTVTVFLDDVRISTNVVLKPGERALGTRVSNEVRTKVLEQGEVLINSDFLVNDWFIAAYKPIVDINGERVGMLYTGYLEAPFRVAFWKALGVLVLLFIVLMLLSAWLSIRGAKSIFKPLEAMSAVVRATRDGKQQRIGKQKSTDEIGELSRELDIMLDQLQERNQLIQQSAALLEIKVTRRTTELELKNADLYKTIAVLRQTREQLVQSEKMAALGELTAGVAHEINNPTQVILGNLDVVIEAMGSHIEPVNEELELVIHQVYRIQDIINNLLQYARPGEYAGYLKEINVNTVVNNTQKLLKHMQRTNPFKLELDLQAEKVVRMNEQELEQVLVNLVTNAIHALDKEPGIINVATRDWSDKNGVNKGVVIKIKDNGSGMTQEQISRIFNPFYSTKKSGEGTGLGLSLSYSLMRHYGGNISVESELGEGAEFNVWILAEPVLVDDEETISEQLHEFESVVAHVNFAE
ncbi:MAG: cache domain-containing protein [Gammaproteobacteria bacterium]|nr:cache domain-containing protein [Gammaproteobacteria bacterium]